MSVPLHRLARAHAAVDSTFESEDKVLAEHKLTLARFRTAKLHWLEKMAAQSARGQHGIAKRYHEIYNAELQRTSANTEAVVQAGVRPSADATPTEILYPTAKVEAEARAVLALEAYAALCAELAGGASLAQTLQAFGLSEAAFEQEQLGWDARFLKDAALRAQFDRHVAYLRNLRSGR